MKNDMKSNGRATGGHFWLVLTQKVNDTPPRTERAA